MSAISMARRLRKYDITQLYTGSERQSHHLLEPFLGSQANY